MLRLFRIFLLSALLPGCTGAFFFPQRQMLASPADAGLTFHDVFFRSADGTQLHGWWLPSRSPARGTVLFMHGNAENISTHFANVAWLPQVGFNVFLFDYRGYGRSEGRAELAGLVADSEAALRHTVEHLATAQDKIILFGQSLGGALAIYAAATSSLKMRLAGVVVESAFSDYRDIAREKLASSWLTWALQWPLSWTINNNYSPVAVVGKISPVPLLIIHSRMDPVIPYRHGQRLFEHADQPKTLWLTARGEHISTATRGPGRQRLTKYFYALAKPTEE